MSILWGIVDVHVIEVFLYHFKMNNYVLRSLISHRKIYVFGLLVLYLN